MAEADHDRMRLRAAALTLHDADGGARDKPDRKADVFADLGSPVSPLRLRPSVATSSSSSSGSAKSPAPSNAGMAGGRSHSGELVGECNPPRLMAHRRSGSGQLIFSGSSNRGSGGGDRGSTASSPMLNALPTGNICPSGRVPATAATPPPPRSRPDVLGSGTGHYGHGSIMRGAGMAPARSSIDSSSFLGHSSRSPASFPASSGGLQEVTRLGNEWYKKGKYGEALRHYERAVALCPESAACRGNRAAALIGLGRLADTLRECEEAVRSTRSAAVPTASSQAFVSGELTAVFLPPPLRYSLY